MSRHFSKAEFACPHCHVALVRPHLEQLLERIRLAAGGRPLRIMSGYRCPVHNKQIHGAADSQHMYGAAADLPPGRVSFDIARKAGATGVGTKGPWATHVDVRDGPFVHWTYPA